MYNKRTMITTDNGERVEADTPVIISASRHTDIPAFYMDWFFERLERGYSAYTDYFLHKKRYVSYKNTRFIVFWSKNPVNLTKYLDVLKEKNIGTYVQFTLNDYEKEGLEKGIPSLQKRIDTFVALSEKLGKKSVIWRFDPLVMTETLGVDELIERIGAVGDRLFGYTEKLVFSFVDFKNEAGGNADKTREKCRSFDSERMNLFAKKLSLLNKEKKWGYRLATCGETIDLEKYGIEHNHCIDEELIARSAWRDEKLMDFLGAKLCFVKRNGEPLPKSAIKVTDKGYVILGYNPDPNRRIGCGCMKSTEIGDFNTCIHGCDYCFANAEREHVLENYRHFCKNSHADTITGI